MKVLQLLSNPYIGGTEKFIMTLVPTLQKMRIDLHFANYWGHTEFEDAVIKTGVPFTRLKESRDRAPSLQGILNLCSLLRREQFDVVCAYGLTIGLIMRLLRFVMPKSILVTGLRGIDNWWKWYHVAMDRLTQNLVDKYVCGTLCCRPLSTKWRKGKRRG